MIYTPPSRPKGRSRTGNLPVRVVFYGFFCRHGDKAPLFCFVRRMISAQAAKGGRSAGEPPLCSLWFPALPLRTVPCGEAGAASRNPVSAARLPLPCVPLDCALQGGRSGLRNPASMARLFSHVCRASALPCVPFGLCLTGRQERPPAIPLPWRASPPMHAAPCARSSWGTPCPGRFAAPVRKLLFQTAPAGKSGLRVHSVQIQSLRIQQIA